MRVQELQSDPERSQFAVALVAVSRSRDHSGAGERGDG
jgi:hypothetical protein